MFELVWTLVNRTQPSGPLCLGQCFKLNLPLKWTISGGAKPLPQCQVVPESRHRGPGWVCEVTKDDLPDCEVSKVLSRKIFRSLYLYLWCPCQWKYARSRNKHARPKRNSEYFFTIRLFPTHQTTSYYGPIVLYIDLLIIVPGDELAMIIRRKKRKKKTHLSQKVHQLTAYYKYKITSYWRRYPPQFDAHFGKIYVKK